MKHLLISLTSNAPPGFEPRQPTKRDLLRDQIAIFADSLESCTALLDDFLDRVEGLVITMEDRFSITQVGPRLWHLSTTPNSTQDLKELATFCLAQIETNCTLHEKTALLKTQLGRYKREQGQTQKDVNSYATHLAAKVKHLRKEVKRRKELEEQLRLFKMFAENAQQGVGWVTLTGRIVYMNAAMAALHGDSDPNDLIGGNILDYYSEKDRKKLRALITSELIEEGMWNGELNLVRQESGEVIPAYHHTRLIHDSELGQTYIAAIVTDLREQKKNEKEQLKIEKLEAVGFLAGGIAHDFNNLLTIILGNIELIDMHTPPDSKEHAYVEFVRRASNRAKNLTSQLLTFAKGGQPVLQQTSISTIITESVEFILHGSSVACHYDIPDDIFDIQADSGQLNQVIHNIIINACHAMPEGGDISISCENVRADSSSEMHKKPMVRISITDNGPGIPPKYIDKIFDPYFSTKQSGSGLGLAICHSIITKHGGTISVQSQPGKGTSFTIELPACTTPQPDSKTNLHKKKANPTPAQKIRILVMDDEADIREYANEAFGALGHKTVTAKDGAEALEIYREQQENGTPIDLTFLDLTVPGGMGGKEAAAELLKLNSEAIVIVSSGYCDDPVIANCRDYGFTASISKPFSVSELQSLLDTLEI